MTVVRLCPDSLVASARRGMLSPDDRARLDAHLDQCGMCRVALEVGHDFDRVLGARAGDEKIAERIAAAVARPVPEKRAATGRSRVVWALAAAALLVASVATAATRTDLLRAVWGIAAPAPEPHPPRPISRRDRAVDEPAAGATATAAREPAPAPAPVPVSGEERLAADTLEAADREAEPEPGRRPSRRAAAHRASAPPSTEPADGPTATDLFARANASRRAGEQAVARSLYLELQARHPRSIEAAVSHVTLGRVLASGGDVRAALAQFDAYLAQRVHTALAEEALFGRASALMRLDRRAEERATWSELLARFPHSVYADRARARAGAEP
jgi:TolA-binding protein